ncbi:hypothetical protein GGF50DRAFT_97102, partial [Schizophyllum commune]
MAFLFQNRHGQNSKRGRSPPEPPKTPNPSAEDVPHLITKSPATNRVVKRGREHDTPRITVPTRSPSPPAPQPRTPRLQATTFQLPPAHIALSGALPPVAAPWRPPMPTSETIDDAEKLRRLLSKAASLAKTVPPSLNTATYVNQLAKWSGIPLEAPTIAPPPVFVTHTPVAPPTHTPPAPVAPDSHAPEEPPRSYAATVQSRTTRPPPPPHPVRPEKPRVHPNAPPARTPDTPRRRPTRRLLLIPDQPLRHPDPTKRPHPQTILDAINKPAIVAAGDALTAASYTRGGTLALHTQSPASASRILARYSMNIIRSLSKLFHFDPSKSELLLDTKWEKVVIQQVPLPPQSYWPTYTEGDPSGEFSRAVSGWLEDITKKVNKAGSRQGLRQLMPLVRDRTNGVLHAAADTAQHGCLRTISFVAAFSEEGTANSLLRNGICLVGAHCRVAQYRPRYP